MVLKQNSWRNVLFLLRLIGNRLVRWLGIKKSVLDRKSFTNLEFTVCKGQDQNYIGGAALKMSVVLSWNRTMGSGKLLEMIVCGHSLLCPSVQMWKRCFYSGQSSFKMEWEQPANWNLKLFLENTVAVSSRQKGERPSGLFSTLSVQTPVSLMVWRYISAYRVSCLHIWKAIMKGIHRF